jgi:hypothetical protein
VMLMSQCTSSEHPLEVAGHDPWMLGSVTLWSGPGPVIVTAPLASPGRTHEGALGEETVTLSV